MNEGSWLLAGALIAAGIVYGFLSILALPLLLLGLSALMLLSLDKRPGAWILLTGASGLPSAHYLMDFLNGGTCPYSSLDLGGPPGPSCGPPDVLYIFLALVTLTVASLGLGLRSLRRSSSRTL